MRHRFWSLAATTQRMLFERLNHVLTIVLSLNRRRIGTDLEHVSPIYMAFVGLYL